MYNLISSVVLHVVLRHLVLGKLRVLHKTQYVLLVNL